MVIEPLHALVAGTAVRGFGWTHYFASLAVSFLIDVWNLIIVLVSAFTVLFKLQAFPFLHFHLAVAILLFLQLYDRSFLRDMTLHLCP